MKPFAFLVTSLTVGAVAVGCGKVKSSSPDGGGVDVDASPQDVIDGGADEIDAAPGCSDFVVPPGALALHDRFCDSALGFNPTVTPDNMTLPCPGAGTATPGTYGKILRPAAIDQADGCPATVPFTRMLAPLPDGSIVQMSTAANLTVVGGDRLRVRISCPADTASCQGQIQITGRATAGGGLVTIAPGQPVPSNAVVDIDEVLPASLVGATTIINFLVISNGAGNPDLLWENPSLGP